MESKAEKLAVIEKMLQQHKTLCPDLFDGHNVLLPHIRQKFLSLGQYMREYFLPMFPHVNIREMMLVGSSCSYAYRDDGDLDFFIIIDNIFPEKPELSAKILNNLAYSVFMCKWRPHIYNRPVDFAVLDVNNERIKDINSYSVLRNKWMIEPIRQPFPFSAEELFDKYCKYSADLHRFVAELPKEDEIFLTAESAQKLSAYLKNLREEAFLAKFFSIQREYSPEYNLYRLLKRFGAYRHFQNYISDSVNYLMGKK